MVLVLVMAALPAVVFADPLSSQQISRQGATRYFNTIGGEVTSGTPQLGINNVVVSTDKTIEGTDIENEFIITLNVNSTVDISEVRMSADAAVVLVLDVSGSMGMTNPTYISQLITAAKDFLDEFATVESDAARYVSLVTYATNATIQSGWIDISSSNPATLPNLNYLKKTIDGLAANGGTYIQGGLQLARNLMRTEALPNGRDGMPVENRSVILFTDGVPTYYNTGNLNSVAYAAGTTIVSNAGPGGSYDAPTLSNTISMANVVSDREKNGYFIAGGITYPKYDAKLYTIGFGGGTDNDWLRDNIATNSTYHFSAGNASQLNSAFAAINQRIENWARAWVVSDPMGTDIEFIETIAQNDSDDGLLDFRGNTLQWDLKKALPEINGDVFTYTYSYRVRLDTTSGTFVPDTPIPANGITTLDYVMVENGVMGDNVYKAFFDVPEVEGYTGGFEFLKVNENGEILPECEFRLENQIPGKPSYTATSGADGKVSFAGIPSGFIYTLKETALAAGMADIYTLSGDVLTLGVVMGEVSVTDNSGGVFAPGSEFVNKKKKYDFSFTKIDGNLFARNRHVLKLPGAEFAVFQCAVPGHEMELVPADVINGAQTSPYWLPYDVNGGSNRVTSDANGLVTLSLEPGFYMLVETKAPHVGGVQYVLPYGQWSLKAENAQVVVNGAVADASDRQPPAFTSDGNLPNLRQHDLPLAGGRGIAIFVGTGGLLVVAGIVLIVVYQRRRTLPLKQY